MAQGQVGSVIAQILRYILLFLFKVVAITFAWACKLLGTILTTVGEYLEKAIVK
jgi:hypothetical protein